MIKIDPEVMREATAALDEALAGKPLSPHAEPAPGVPPPAVFHIGTNGTINNGPVTIGVQVIHLDD